MLCRLCHLLLPWLDLEEEHLWKSTLKQFFMVVGVLQFFLNTCPDSSCVPVFS